MGFLQTVLQVGPWTPAKQRQQHGKNMSLWALQACAYQISEHIDHELARVAATQQQCLLGVLNQ